MRHKILPHARRQTPRRADVQPPDSTQEPFEINVVRSTRRTKTVGIRLLNWHTLEVRVPASMSESELQRMLPGIKQRALEQRQRMRAYKSDETLEGRAQALNQRHFEGALHWRSIRFVDNQHQRFGSCTPALGTIRISRRLAAVPDFVLDYVLVHELAHLIEPGHTNAFWNLVYRYPLTERARGYLMALQLEDDQHENPILT